MNTPFDTLPAPRARRTDPATSHAAATRVRRTGTQLSHAALIVSVVVSRPGVTAADIARETGLSVVQVDRRAIELERSGYVRFDGERDGFRQWWPTGGRP